MEFQEKIAKYTGHQLNSLADVQAILNVAGRMALGRQVGSYSVTGNGSNISVELTVSGCTITIKQGQWLLHKPTGDGGGTLFTLSQEQMDERYEAVADDEQRMRERKAYEDLKKRALPSVTPPNNLGGLINEQIRQQRERDVQQGRIAQGYINRPSWNGHIYGDKL